MKIVTKIAATCIAALAFVSLSGCGSESTTAQGGKSEIIVWSQVTGPDGEAAKNTFDAYNKTNPEVKVKMLTMKKDTFNAKLATAARSGKDVPDIAWVASEEVPSWHSQGILEPWDEMLSGTKLTEDAYLPAAWSAGQVEGSQYGIPGTMGTWLMYYNKDLVEKYAPGSMDDNIATFEEIEKAGAAAKKDGIYSYSNSWAFQNYDNLYLQMGGKWTDSNGKISVNNETSIKVFEELKKLYDAGYMVPDGEEAVKLFMNGKLIFMPEGTWQLSTIKEAKFNWGETTVPQWDMNNLVQCSGADQYVIVKSKEARSAEKQKGMVAFMEWLQSNQLEMLKSGANPSAKAMLENKEYASMPQSFLLNDEKISQAVNVINTPGLSYVNTEIDARAWDMITGKADIKETMEEIQKIAEQKMQN